jgi:hypothetical protein
MIRVLFVFLLIFGTSTMSAITSQEPAKKDPPKEVAGRPLGKTWKEYVTVKKATVDTYKDVRAVRGPEKEGKVEFVLNGPDLKLNRLPKGTEITDADGITWVLPDDCRVISCMATKKKTTEEKPKAK